MMPYPYGWGGLLDNRDCSMFLRDLFLPFGVFLPRNSKDQAAIEKKGYVDLSKFSIEEKLDYLKHNAVAFGTLLYMRGHVLLYVGQKDGEPLVLHDVWGFAYNEDAKEKRFVVGRPVISTLHLGEKHDGFEEKRSLAARLLGVRDITP